MRRALMPVSDMRRHVWIQDEGRLMGIHVMGAKGTGKSRLLGRILAWFDFLRGVPTIVLDPLGGTVDNFLEKCLDESPDVLERVRYVNMSGMGGHVVPFPFYVRMGNEGLHATARRYVDLIHRLDPDLVHAPIFGWNAFENLATYMGMALAGMGLQITDGLSLLAEPERYRGRLTAAVKTFPELEPVVRFFYTEYKNWEPRWRAEQAQSLRNKLLPYELSPANAAMFGATPAIDWDEVFAKRQIVLLDLRDEQNLSDLRLKVIWAYTYLMTYLSKRSQTRSLPLSLIIDEISYFLPPRSGASLLEDELDELINRTGRAYGIWLTVAHQELWQLPESAQRNVMTMGTQIFGATADGGTARGLARKYFPYDPDFIKRSDNVYGATRTFPPPVIDTRDYPYSIEEQVELASRQFLDLTRYRFLVGTTVREGELASSLRPMTIANYDRDQFPDTAQLSEVRSALMRSHGQPIAAPRSEPRLTTPTTTRLEELP